MENKLLPGSNTLANVLALAEGNALHFTLMPDGNGNVSVLLKPVVMKNGKAVKDFPVLEGSISLENVDAEFTGEVYRIFQGEFAQSTHQIIDYAQALQKEASNLSSAKNSANLVKPGETMPPPTGKKEPEKPKGPGKPAAPAKPGKTGTELVESSGTGPNAPAKPAPAPDATNEVAPKEGVEPLITDVVAEPVVVTNPLQQAVADGWIEHPTAPGYYYKGQEVLLTADVEAKYMGSAADAVPLGF